MNCVTLWSKYMDKEVKMCHFALITGVAADFPD